MRSQPVKIQAIPSEEKVLVKLSYPMMLEFFCQMHVHDFPYDIQACTLTIASWTRKAAEIKYRPAAPINTKYMKKNSEWTLFKTLQWENLVNYSLFVYPNPERMFHVQY